MTAGGWVDRAYVGLLPDFSRFLTETNQGINRALSGVQREVDRVVDRVDRSFVELARSATESLGDIGSAATFAPITARAQVAGEEVERAFSEAQRGATESLGDIGRATAFASITARAQVAGEQVERAFSEAQRGADASLRRIGGPGQFTPIRMQAAAAANGISRDFNRASVSARASLGGLRVIGFGVGAALVGVFGLVGAAAAKMGVAAVAASEQAEISFSQLLGSGERAKSFLEDLEHFAATTPFEMPGLVAAARQLLGAGQAAKDVIPIMTALGDATGALGLNQEQFQRIMLATTQSMNKGKIQGEELLQFLEAGIPVWKLMSDATGLPIPKLREMSEKGQLLSAEVLPKLFAEMRKDYGGAMAKQSRTLNGLWSTFMDTVRNGLRNTLTPFAGFMKNTLSGAITTAGAAFEKLPGKIQAALDSVRETSRSRVGEFVKGWGQLMIDGIKAGVSEGNWKPLGDALRLGFRGAIFGLAGGKGKDQNIGQQILDDLATGLEIGNWSPLGETLGRKIAEQALRIPQFLGQVDWRKLGQDAAGFAVPFALGFAGGLFDAFISAFREDFWGTLMDIAMVVPIGRAAGALLRLVPPLVRVPLVGGLLRGLSGIGRAIEKPIVGIGGGILRLLAEGFQREFPRAAGLIGRFLRRLADDIGLRALYFRDAAGRIVGGLVRGIGQASGQLVRAAGLIIRILLSPFAEAGRLLLGAGGLIVRGLVLGITRGLPAVGRVILTTIRMLVSPFARAGGWLLREGSDLLGGLGRGITGRWPSVAAWIRETIRRLLSPFAGIGRWLVDEGRRLLDGLGSGIRARWGSLTSWMTQTRGRITGAFRTAFSLLTGAGRNIINGLVDGMRRAIPTIGGIVRSVKDAIVNGIKRLFGMTSPSRVMAGLGSNMMAGLVKGLVGDRNVLQSILKSIGGDVLEAFGGLGGGSARGLVGFARTAFNFFRGMFPGMTIGGWRARGSVPGSDHPKGKALDLMTTSGFVASAIIAAFRMMPAAKYWIWNRQIASAPDWRPRGYSGPSPHTDHVHLSFFQRGAWEVLRDTLGLVHRGEMVVPRDFASGLRNALAGFSASSADLVGVFDGFADRLVDVWRGEVRGRIVPWLRRIALGVEGRRGGGATSSRPAAPRPAAGSAAPPSGHRLTAWQLERLPDNDRWDYVQRYGRPPAPAGYVWLEDHTLRPLSDYGRSFDQGGWWRPGTAGVNRSGTWERVLDPEESRLWAAIERAIAAPAAAPAQPAAGPTVTVQQGAVQVIVQGPVTRELLPQVTASVEDGLRQVLAELRTGVRA